MNPKHIKRREYIGLTALTAGVLAGLIGIGGLLTSMTMGLVFISLGAAGMTVGAVVLHKIPDVIGQPEELW